MRIEHWIFVVVATLVSASIYDLALKCFDDGLEAVAPEPVVLEPDFIGQTFTPLVEVETEFVENGEK